ncbi:hypothetical protein JB92DRAFT_2752376 [Gautieria morchelliformis]|nr:hypothetical protein JB92DRAFT_2752376 [Gautieria morchelliformis]
MREKKINDIALDLNMSKGVVERILQLWHTTGVVVQGHGKMGNRGKIMTPEEMEFLLRLTEQFPDLYLDEIPSIMQHLYGITVGISTIVMNRYVLMLCPLLVYSCFPQLSKVAAKHNENLHTLFGFKIGHESPEHLVFIDESHIDCRTTYHLNGWAPKGKRASVKARFVRGTG